MKYQIHHKTVYRYSEPASLSHNELFLLPRPTAAQQIESSALTIHPEPQHMHERTDFFGNRVQVFMLQHPHQELSVISECVVQTLASGLISVPASPPWEEVARQLRYYADAETLEAYQFVFSSPMAGLDDAITDYCRLSFPPGRQLAQGSMDLMQRIHRDFTYDKNATSIDTSVSQVMKKRRGVCQDFAHLAISCLRGLGLAARYVSGYLETVPPPGKKKLVGSDASHAWLAVFIPGHGWLDIDPTNNMIPAEQHVTIAWGRDYGDVTPVKGIVMGGGIHSLEVSVDMQPLETQQ